MRIYLPLRMGNTTPKMSTIDRVITPLNSFLMYLTLYDLLGDTGLQGSSVVERWGRNYGDLDLRLGHGGLPL